MSERNYQKPQPSRPLVVGEAPIDFAERLRSLIRDAKDLVRHRRRLWNGWAHALYISQIATGTGATILIGMVSTGWLGAVAISLSATTTALSAAGSWFALRPRAEAADRALAAWHRAEDELELYVAATSSKDLSIARLQEIDAKRVDAWDEYSRKWLEARSVGTVRASRT